MGERQRGAAVPAVLEPLRGQFSGHYCEGPDPLPLLRRRLLHELLQPGALHAGRRGGLCYGAWLVRPLALSTHGVSVMAPGFGHSKGPRRAAGRERHSISLFPLPGPRPVRPAGVDVLNARRFWTFDS